MKAAPLTLNRLEFAEVSIRSNENFEPQEDCYAPQLNFDFSGCVFRRRSLLEFRDEELAAPKNFAFRFELSLKEDEQKDDICPPYFFSLAVQAFMTVEESAFDNNPAELFRAVRHTGYSMVYGAMREMVANLTARSSHGMLQLPTAHFQESARTEAERDERHRVERLKALGTDVKSSVPIEFSDPPKDRPKAKRKAPAKKSVKQDNN